MKSVFLKTAAVIAALAAAAAFASCSESGSKTDKSSTAALGTATQQAAENSAQTKIVDVTNEKGKVIATSVVTVGKGNSSGADSGKKITSAANNGADNKTIATNKTNATNATKATKKQNGTIGTNTQNNTNKTNGTNKTNATIATKKPNSAVGGAKDPAAADKF